MNKIIPLNFLLFSLTLLSHTLYKDFNGYVAIEKLSPGQLRYISPRVDAIVTRLQLASKKFNKHTSSFKLTQSIPVILGPDNLIIVVDNHQTYLAAKKLGDTTIPIKVIDNLSTISARTFYEKAIECHYIYPYDNYGNKIHPFLHEWYSWDLMQDDPNLFFVYLTGWYYLETKYMKNLDATAFPLHPLWVKDINNAQLAFIEFKIATLLYQAGLYFNYAWGTNPNSPALLEFTEHARLVLEEIIHEHEDVLLESVLAHPIF